MKRHFIFLLFSVVLVVSCEYDFDLGYDDAVPKMMIRSYPGDNNDTTVIQITRTVPLNQPKKQSHEFQLESLSATVNGSEVKMVQVDSVDWYFVHHFSGGEKLSVSLKAAGSPAVSARTMVPVKPKVGAVDVGLKSDSDGDYVNFSISVDDDPFTDDFYGIMMVRYNRLVIGEIGKEPSLNETGEDCEYPAVTALDNTLLGNLSAEHHRTADFYTPDGQWRLMTIFDDKHLVDGKYDICYYYYPDEDIVYEGWVDNEDGSSQRTTMFRRRTVSYRCFVYKLSPEAYYSLKASYNLDNNFLAEFGLSSPSFTYSNIENGYGFFAGVNRWESPLFPNPVKN